MNEPHDSESRLLRERPGATASWYRAPDRCGLGSVLLQAVSSGEELLAKTRDCLEVPGCEWYGDHVAVPVIGAASTPATNALRGRP
jgi:hypothetical protein